MEISETLNLQDCTTIVQKCLQSDDVFASDFKLKSLQNQNFELEVTFLQNQEKKKVTLFAKSSLNTPKINDILYNDFGVLPKFDSSLIPKLYYVKAGFQIFENLKTQNFNAESGFFGKDHLLVVLKALAKLHAASFAFESKTGSKLDKKFALLHLNFLVKSPEVKSAISKMVSEEEVTRVVDDLEEKQFSSKFRRTLCHGNLQSKNVFFKLEKGVPVECRFINLKSNFYAPPMYDVLQAIFFNTDGKMRQRHFHTLLFEYHKFLKEEMEEYLLDIDEILTLQNLLLSAHYFLPLVKLEATLSQNEERKEELGEILTCPLLSREDCYVIVRNKIGTTDYDFSSFKVTPLNDVSGFLGEYHKLKIEILHFGEEKTINCFIKCPPNNGIPKELARDVGSFSREIFMYETLVPLIKKSGIHIIDECVPPCYFQRHEDVIVFEDMSLLHYRNMDALKPLDLTHLQMLVTKLAKFHACSLIFEEKVSEEMSKPYRLIDNYKEYFKEPLFFENENHLGAKTFMTGLKSIPAAVNLLSEIKTEENLKNFEKFWPKFKELFYTVIKPSDRFRNVLSHGDLWTSNMMVKTQDNKLDCVFIDFQIVRYCPPAYDLLSVLHLTTDRSTRMKYEKELIKLYYSELDNNLKRFGFEVENFYSYGDYISCIEYMKPQMVLQAAIDCVLTMCTPEEISSFLTNDEECKYVYFEDRTEFLTAMCSKSVLYRTRLKECILDIYDYCNSVYEK